MPLKTFTFQLSYHLNGSAESFPVEIQGENAQLAEIDLRGRALSMFQGVTNLKTELLYSP